MAPVDLQPQLFIQEKEPKKYKKQKKNASIGNTGYNSAVKPHGNSKLAKQMK